jgi:hypothetical protein
MPALHTEAEVAASVDTLALAETVTSGTVVDKAALEDSLAPVVIPSSHTEVGAVDIEERCDSSGTRELRDSESVPGED